MKNIRATRIFCMVLAALMLSLILVQAGSAAIGVEEGDWAKYDIEVEIEVPEEMEDTTGFEEMEEMEWVKAEVESVSDTTVVVEETIHYKNGTETTETIEDAIGQVLIEADLGEGDEVTILFIGEMTLNINGTVSRTYAGASREVNYVDVTVWEDSMPGTMKAYWDKATGFVCEMSISVSAEVEGETVGISMSYKMTETNMWEAGLLSGPWLWILVVIIVVVVVAGSAVLLLRRRKAPLPEVAPSPTE